MASGRIHRWSTAHVFSCLGMCLVGSLCVAGCVHRRVVIRSDPPGALVELDGHEVGFTPLAVDFRYYATRELRLSKPGFETLTVLQPVPPPWYQRFPFEFFSDNLLGFHVTDRRELPVYRLTRQRIPGTEELLGRANGLRAEARVGP